MRYLPWANRNQDYMMNPKSDFLKYQFQHQKPAPMLSAFNDLSL